MRNKLTLFISVLILSLSFISSGFILQNKGKVFADARDDLNSYCEQNHSRSLPNGSDAEIICRIGDPQDILRDDRVGELWNALSEEQKSTARNEDHCEQIYDDQSIIDSCKDLVNEQTGAAEVQDANCENRSAAMGWIMCPLIYATDEALEWIDNSIESLLEVDRNRYDNPEMRDAWANIRNIAYLILVPIALVMVISTALGFEFISAYTVKRALPRLGAAVIFIALSYQITILLIDISNGIGFSTKGLLQAPFNMGGDINLQTLFGGSPLTSIVSLPVAAVGVVLIAWLFGGTLLLFAGSAFLVLMFRQILIVALMLVAPLAILAWIFPGNDKLWKTWWGTFSKLLMMFPLIMAVISVGHIFAWILDRPNEGGVAGVLQPLMILAAYLLPYAAIPFTFKFAGGMFATISGIANDRSKGLFDRQRKRRAEKYATGRRVADQYRANANRDLLTRASSGNRAKGMLMRGLARGVAGRDIEARMSAYNAEEGKKVNDQIATGVDNDIRGSTVDLKAAQKTTAAQQRADGTWDESELKNALWRVDKNGKREYKTLGGAWVQEADVINGQRRFGRNRAAQQAALSYEMRKAMTDDQVEDLRERYFETATQQWGMTDTEAQGAWIGAAFENQNQQLLYKYTKHKRNKDTGETERSFDGAGFATEIYEKRGSYQMSQMGAQTLAALKEAHDKGDDETKRKVRAIAETFMARYGETGGMMAEEDGKPIPATGSTATTGSSPGASSSYRTQTAGAGHAAEVVRDLAVHVGVYGPLDPSTDTRSTSGPYPDKRQL